MIVVVAFVIAMVMIAVIVPGMVMLVMIMFVMMILADFELVALDQLGQRIAGHRVSVALPRPAT